jgi:hypothetical protein
MHKFLTMVTVATLLGGGACFAEDAVKVSASCVATHGGYKGIIVAPGLSQPSGKIMKLECNSKNVELGSDSMKDGKVATKQFGEVSIRFGSMVATVGAGDFTSVGPGQTAKERIAELYVPAANANDFSNFIGK